MAKDRLTKPVHDFVNNARPLPYLKRNGESRLGVLFSLLRFPLWCIARHRGRVVLDLILVHQMRLPGLRRTSSAPAGECCPSRHRCRKEPEYGILDASIDVSSPPRADSGMLSPAARSSAVRSGGSAVRAQVRGIRPRPAQALLA